MDGLRGFDHAILKGESFLGKPCDVEHGARHDAVTHPREQHARIIGLGQSKGFLALADFLGKAFKIGQAPRRPQRRPSGKGGLRGGNSGIDSAPYRREKKEVSNERSGSLVMTCTHRTNLGQKWLRPRKRRGTTACSEKAQSVEAIYGAAGQGKTCMAKAILPEPQFAATYTASGAAQWLTRRFGRSESAMFILSASRSSDVERPGLPARPTHPLYGGASERTGRLNTSQPPTRVNAGSPKQDGLGSCPTAWCSLFGPPAISA